MKLLHEGVGIKTDNAHPNQKFAPALSAMPPNASKTPQRPPTLPQQIDEIRPGQSIALLQELHILTREGRLNQDTRRKLKQVFHLVRFIEPLLDSVFASHAAAASGASTGPVLADHGAGKSYLGFLIYDLYFNVAHQGLKKDGWIYGIETRSELVEKSRLLAARLGFARMGFLNLSVQQATASDALPPVVDIVTALHAATDDAIAFGLARQATHMVLVPCCQAEVAGMLRKNSKGQRPLTRLLASGSAASQSLAELWRHPLHAREFGSHITNVLRCLQLEAHGYEVTVTELVGWEHSMKNELILASKPASTSNQAAAQQKAQMARQRLFAVLDELGMGEGLKHRFAAGLEV